MPYLQESIFFVLATARKEPLAVPTVLPTLCADIRTEVKQIPHMGQPEMFSCEELTDRRLHQIVRYTLP